MQWRKSPRQLIDTFEAVMPGPPAVLRNMFGYPAGFVNGNMFMGLHQENMVVRLPEQWREKLLSTSGAKIFEPMQSRPMREYVVLPPAVVDEKEKLQFWVAKALEYGLSLKPKPVSKTAVKSAAKEKSAER
jgi:TfoX/Sxy family transcriptional regulator of competence genes